MRIAIAYNEPRPDADATDRDVLVQRDSVAAALTALGHDVVLLPCSLDLTGLATSLANASPDVVFNLVESLGGTDRLQALVPALLEGLDVPFTGTRTGAMLATADKVLVKRRLRKLNLPTTDWIERDDAADVAAGRFIIKARFEHASAGLDDQSVVDVTDIGKLRDMVQRRSDQCGMEMFAERFVDGREFNISVIAEKDGSCRVLAPAEIDFSAFPVSKPKIVGYDAKWSDDSFEFKATPRSFEFPGSDRRLLEKLTHTSTDIWYLFGLRGHVRIDYRVDAAGSPFVLEINTNPCLSPDAGFTAAVEHSGYSFAWAIERIIADAVSKR